MMIFAADAATLTPYVASITVCCVQEGNCCMLGPGRHIIPGNRISSKLFISQFLHALYFRNKKQPQDQLGFRLVYLNLKQDVTTVDGPRLALAQKSDHIEIM